MGQQMQQTNNFNNGPNASPLPRLLRALVFLGRGFINGNNADYPLAIINR
jgi:hypothetical protein